MTKSVENNDKKAITKTPKRKNPVFNRRVGDNPDKLRRRTDKLEREAVVEGCGRYFDIKLWCHRCPNTKIVRLDQDNYNKWMRGEAPAAKLFTLLSKLDRRWLVKHRCPDCKI